MAELTLDVPEHLVATAKAEAAARKQTISELVTDMFRELPANDQQDSTPVEQELTPRTKRLAGCIPDARMEDYIDYLERKHS